VAGWEGAFASLPSGPSVGLAGGSFGASALFGYFLGKQKVTSLWKNNDWDDKPTLEESSQK
jgi:hypothetical protein